MIKYMNLEGRFEPVLVCDDCDQRIETADEGAVLFVANEEAAALFMNGEEVKEAKAYYLHKGECLGQMEDRLGRYTEPFVEEVEEVTLRMAHHLGLTTEAAWLEELDEE